MADAPRIFITGGSRGIGLAIARRFHSTGATVGLCARDGERLAAVAEDLPGVQTWSCDLSDRVQALEAAETIAADFGPVDLLVHNAGYFIADDIGSLDYNGFDRLMETNLTSAVVFSKALVPAMRDRRAGTIVHINSVAGNTGYPRGLSYCISKHAMLGLARALREELKPFGIRVVSILPGATWTQTWSGTDVAEERTMPVEDIAEAVWLAWSTSPRAVIEELVIRPQLGDI